MNIKSVQSFASANGVKSVLQTKPQFIKGVNPSELQYMRGTNKQKSKVTFWGVLKTIYSGIKTVQQNLNEVGVSSYAAIKSRKNGTPCAPGAIFGKLKDKKHIANLPIQNRGSKKFIDANFNKLDFGDNTLVYVLKNDKKQLGYIEVVKKEGNEMYVEFMTNILGRKKYRNIENKMLQGMVEDCINQGFVPKIQACAVDIGEAMGRGYNNRALYERMGAKKNAEGLYEIMPQDVAAIIKKQIQKNGEIISGTQSRLEKIQN